MTQLALPLVREGLRLELGPAEMSWREGETVRRVYFYACCIDTGWPWFQPDMVA